MLMVYLWYLNQAASKMIHWYVPFAMQIVVSCRLPGRLRLNKRDIDIRFLTDCIQNWPSWLKWAVLIQVSFMAFLGPYNAALVNPSLVLLADSISVDSKTAAYSTTTSIIIGGVSPFIWTPLTNYYGRRPITLLAIFVTIMGGIGSGLSPDFNALVGTRALCGFGFGGMMSVGTACVNDMFFLHERGEKTGVYSIFVTNGAHVAAISKLPRYPSYSKRYPL
jgi:hypothetical protein